MKRKVKIEVEGPDGVKIKIEVPEYDPEKVYMYLKALKMVSPEVENDASSMFSGSDESLIDRVSKLIRTEFGLSMFSLNDLYRAYQLKYGEDIPKSTLSTYLSRFVADGWLERIGRRGRYHYRIAKLAGLDTFYK